MELRPPFISPFISLIYVSKCQVGYTKCRQVLFLNTNDSRVMNLYHTKRRLFFL